MAPATSTRQTKRVCDECRARKVKCDVVLPQCSNCRMSDLQCRYNTPIKKRGPRFRNVPRGVTTVEAGSTSTGSELFSPQGLVLMPTPDAVPRGVSTGSTSADSELFSPRSQVLMPTPDADSIVLESVPLPRVFSREALIIRDQLLLAIQELRPGVILEHLVSQYVDVHMQFAFPISPLVHERTLRSNISLVSPASNISTPPATTSQDGRHEADELFTARSFALLAGICARSAGLGLARLPKDSEISSLFLDASQQMLKLYHDRDIKNPDSSSLVIRLILVNRAHAAGQSHLSWFMLGEAIRLAQDMRLHDESAMVGLEPTEAQLRRNVFWQLSNADKTTALLDNRPLTFIEANFETPISILHRKWNDTCLMDPGMAYNTQQFEQCIGVGYKKSQDLWGFASKLLSGLRLVQRGRPQLSNEKLSEEQIAALTDAYLDFMSALDELPPWLQHPERGIPDDSSALSEDAIQYHSRAFWIQLVNLQVSFHSLRLVLLQKFADCSLSSLLGVSELPLMIALKKTEIAQDMIRVLQNVPFEALQANGEPCVQKVRLVGASLLEIIHIVKAPQIIARAKADFSTLLDILAKLDSKASDSLRIC